jgi:hypothetical protein
MSYQDALAATAFDLLAMVDNGPTDYTVHALADIAASNLARRYGIAADVVRRGFANYGGIFYGYRL